MAATLLSYCCAYWFSLLVHYVNPSIGGLWGAISAAIVINAIRESALKAGLIRFVGSVVGTMVPMVFAYIFGYNIFAFAFSAFFVIIICYQLPWHDAFHGALITFAVVLVVGQLEQATTAIWFNAVCRLAESIIGITVTLVIVEIFIRIRNVLSLDGTALSQ
jgi:uncharacterized membrane protein YgaE (UPF0421/DUF939 family)